MTTRLALSLALMLLSGCASIPDLTVPYYLARTDLVVVVTQTAACTDDNVPIVETDVKFLPSYSADRSAVGGLHHIDYSTLGSGYTKSNAAIAFFPDGRLKSINASQTSQVAEALPTILSVVSTGVPFTYDASETPTACGFFLNQDSKSSPLTVVYRGTTSFDNEYGGEIELQQLTLPGEQRGRVPEALEPVLGRVSASYRIKKRPGDADGIPPLPDSNPIDAAVPRLDTSEYKGPTLLVREPATASVTVSISREGDPLLYSRSVFVGQHGKPYPLPLPKSAFFGDTSARIVLEESGKLSELSFGSGGALTSAAGSLQALVDTFDETTAEEAARLKAESDLIYQQRRLVLCRAEPESCEK